MFWICKIHEKDEVVCIRHILNTLFYCLYDLITSMKSPSETWEAQEFKYKIEKRGANKFLIMKYCEFTMENVFVMDQVHEVRVLVSKLNDLNTAISKSMQVVVIIQTYS